MPRRMFPLGLAVVWGVGATWIFWWLFVPVCCGMLFSASEPAIKALLRNGWTGEQIGPYVQGVTTVLPALFYGLIFGFPLGFFAKTSVIVAWVAFVVAFLVALAVRMSLVDSALENLISPIYFLTFLATLLFAFAGYKVHSYISRRLRDR